MILIKDYPLKKGQSAIFRGDWREKPYDKDISTTIVLSDGDPQSIKVPNMAIYSIVRLLLSLAS